MDDAVTHLGKRIKEESSFGWSRSGERRMVSL